MNLYASILTILGALLFNNSSAFNDVAFVGIVRKVMEGNHCTKSINEECRTPEQAGPFLLFAMNKYSIMHPLEISAIMATISTESVNLQYKTNQFPKRAGQGTSNMQMYKFNYEFAKTIPELAEPLSNIESTKENMTNPSNETKNAVRALVIQDAYNFQTGPWYYTTKCCEKIKAKLRNPSTTDEGFNEYSLNCIGVESTEDGRREAFGRAKAAWGFD